MVVDRGGLRDRSSHRRSSLLVGVLYGDALGAPYEFGTPDPDQPLRIGPSVFGHPPGRGTDDIETTLAVAYGLLDAADMSSLLSPERPIADRLLAWYDGGPADVGTTTRAGLERYRSSGDCLGSGSAGERSIANGSLMRSAPFALALGDPAVAAAVAGRSSAVTHRHPLVIACVESYVRLLAGLLDGALVVPGVLDPSWTAYALADDNLDGVPSDLPCEGMGHAGYALALAYWCAASEVAASFEDGMDLVIRAGGDTDTNGAICGAVLAARHGVPDELLRDLDDARVAEVVDVTRRLIDLADAGRR